MTFKLPTKESLEEMEEVLKLAKDEDTLLKLAYVTYPKRDFIFQRGESKDFDVAEMEKHAGNFFYQNKFNKEALMHYNVGIIKCPQDTDEGRKLFSMLLANRSAVFLERKEYEKALNDLLLIEKLGSYPAKTGYKLPWRKGRCLRALHEFEKADEAFDETLKMMRENDSLSETERKDKIQMVENLKKNRKEKERGHENSKFTMLEDIENFEGAEKYISASPLIDITYDSKNGRQAVALEDIPAGTLILKEESYVSIVIESKSKTNCQHCLVSVDQPLPCPKCANVVFCSAACLEIALQSYHGLECPIYASLQDCGSNASIALRIFTQKGFSFFHDQKSKLLEYMKDDSNFGLSEKDVYRHDDYDNILRLFWKDSPTTSFNIFVYCATAFIMRALKEAKFFPFETSKNILLFDDELLIAKLVLRHCKMVNYNVHGLGEIRSLDNSVLLRNGLESYFETVRIGVGLFPTFAFFNHSCDPSVIRTSCNRKILVRTIKPIRAGDIIYDNYGYHYLWSPWHERQKALQDNYCFTCMCIPCQEKWPSVEKLQAIIRVPCGNKNCNFIHTIAMKTPNPIKCSSCKRRLDPNEITSITSPIKKLLAAGEELYRERKYGEALKIFSRVLELMYKYTDRADRDIIKVQDLLEFCMAHFGNKSVVYN